MGEGSCYEGVRGWGSGRGLGVGVGVVGFEVGVFVVLCGRFWLCAGDDEYDFASRFVVGEVLCELCESSVDCGVVNFGYFPADAGFAFRSERLREFGDGSDESER